MHAPARGDDDSWSLKDVRWCGCLFCRDFSKASWWIGPADVWKQLTTQQGGKALKTQHPKKAFFSDVFDRQWSLRSETLLNPSANVEQQLSRDGLQRDDWGYNFQQITEMNLQKLSSKPRTLTSKQKIFETSKTKQHPQKTPSPKPQNHPPVRLPLRGSHFSSGATPPAGRTLSAASGRDTRRCGRGWRRRQVEDSGRCRWTFFFFFFVFFSFQKWGRLSA